MNEKFYQNMNGNPQEILCKAEVEGSLWAEAKLLIQYQQGYSQPATNWQSMTHTRICSIDGAWKEQDIFMGYGWFCQARDSDDVMMGP